MECISIDSLLKFYHDNFIMIVRKTITVVDWDEAVEGIYFCPKCGRVGVQKSHSRNHKGCGEVLGLFRKGTSRHHYLKDAFLRMKTMSEFMVYFRETTTTVFDPKVCKSFKDYSKDPDIGLEIHSPVKFVRRFGRRIVFFERLQNSRASINGFFRKTAPLTAVSKEYMKLQDVSKFKQVRCPKIVWSTMREYKDVVFEKGKAGRKTTAVVDSDERPSYSTVVTDYFRKNALRRTAEMDEFIHSLCNHFTGCIDREFSIASLKIKGRQRPKTVLKIFDYLQKSLKEKISNFKAKTIFSDNKTS